MNTSIDIQHLCDLAHKAFNAPVHILSADRKILYHSTSDNVCSPFYSSKEEHLTDIYQENDPFNLPLFRSNNYLENFVLIHIENHDDIKGNKHFFPFLQTFLFFFIFFFLFIIIF